MPSKVRLHQNFTPALLKKSVFSIIRSDMMEMGLSPQNSFFADLFGGSGQMAMEAVSAGFKNIMLLELDKGRFAELMELKNLFGSHAEIFIRRKDAFRYYQFEEATEGLSVYFLDPPYPFWDKTERVQKLARDIISAVPGPLLLIVQSPEKNDMGFDKKSYGSHLLHIYRSWKN